MQKNKDRSVPRSYLDNLSNFLFYRHLKNSGGSMQQEKKAMISVMPVQCFTNWAMFKCNTRGAAGFN